MHIIITLVTLSILFNSCSKSIQPKPLYFDVKVQNNVGNETSTFKIGDTVNFYFSGNPDHVVFFSGEKGRRYKFADKISDTSNNAILRFSTSSTVRNSGKLCLLVSTKYNGYNQINSQDSLNIIKSFPANWTDISDRVNWSRGNGTQISTVDLSDFAKANLPIHLAFRYTADAGATQTSWVINSLGLRHITDDASFCLDSTNFIVPSAFPAWAKSPGWGVVSLSNPNLKFVLNAFSGSTTGLLSPASNASTSSFTINGSTSASSALATETWLISGPVNLHDVLPDAGVTIKDMTTNASNSFYSPLSRKANYAYIFKAPGKYEVTFLSSSSSRDQVNKEAKTMILTIQ